MGSAASVEALKPTNASEIRQTGSLEVARGEVIRLRELLGHLAAQAGFDAVIYDASDLVQGEDSKADFERCCNEVAHIRSALRLSTQSAKRRTRTAQPVFFADANDEDDQQSQSSDESDEDKTL